MKSFTTNVSKQNGYIGIKKFKIVTYAFVV